MDGRCPMTSARLQPVILVNAGFVQRMAPPASVITTALAAASNAAWRNSESVGDMGWDMAYAVPKRCRNVIARLRDGGRPGPRRGRPGVCGAAAPPCAMIAR